jgi:hypothetical protein
MKARFSILIYRQIEAKYLGDRINSFQLKNPWGISPPGVFSALVSNKIRS